MSTTFQPPTFSQAYCYPCLSPAQPHPSGFGLGSVESGRRWQVLHVVQTCLYGDVLCAREIAPALPPGVRDNQSGRLFAIKRLSLHVIATRDRRAIENPFNEVSAMQYLNANGSHPNIIELTEVLRDAENIYIITPYCQGELFRVVLDNRGLSEAVAKRVFRDVIAGMSFVHALNVCHRDLSLENILLTEDGQAKVIDFGMALMVGQPRGYHASGAMPMTGSAAAAAEAGIGRIQIPPMGPAGKKLYMAPEVARNEHAFDGLAVDVWACGIILYLMLVGKRPFDYPEPEQDARCRIIAVERRLVDVVRSRSLPISDEATDLIQSCLLLNPDERKTVPEILAHPWLAV